MSTLPEWGALQAKPNFGTHGFVEPRLGTDPGRWRRWLADDFRRWDRVSGEDGRIFNEEAEHQPIGPRGAGRKKSLPALVPERFAHVLIGRPRLPAWSRQRQADALESIRIAEIGHVEGLHSMAPDVAGELVHRWYAALREVAIPLSPKRFLVVSEVEGVDDVAALPAVIARRLRPEAWVGEVRDLTQPCSRRVDRIDVERQRVGPQTAPGDSSSETTRATWRALPRPINSSGF
jgi:hypothetical protein